MFLARVQGHVVASQKDPQLSGMRLLIIEPLKVDYGSAGGGELGVTGRAIVAVDRIGAGEGQLVLVAQGSSARLMEGCSKMPIDAVIVGLVDTAVVRGEKLSMDKLNSGE
jgi:ethanolamine utilization protein EutN